MSSLFIKQNSKHAQKKTIGFNYLFKKTEERSFHFGLSKTTVQIENYSMECSNKRSEKPIKRGHWMRVISLTIGTLNVSNPKRLWFQEFLNVELCPSGRLIWNQMNAKQKKKVQFDNNVIDKLNRIIKVFMSVEFFSSNELYHVMI